ncbi:hypothetical protein PCASD_01634 [Puccinia coronata f. sp. avenae]|uniref:Uncharacterized protein n=1 Tax=Puccinia coronata f. sp. avenae TaxID=200324 RepID=A0A2N5VIL0_9BASI|nr:hypothetical protein PCASD_01634 [Puccinia coronata f. sp. avenae]
MNFGLKLFLPFIGLERLDQRHTSLFLNLTGLGSLGEQGNLGSCPYTSSCFSTGSYVKNRGLIAGTPIRTPKKNGVQPLHAALERRAEAARPSLKAAHHLHAFNRRAYGAQPCQTGVQSLHACLEGVQSLHALRTGVQALHACRLTSNCAAHKPATKFNHPDPQANDRPRPTDTHQTQPSR